MIQKIQLKDTQPHENFWHTQEYAEDNRTDDAFHAVKFGEKTVDITYANKRGPVMNFPGNAEVWVNREVPQPGVDPDVHIFKDVDDMLIVRAKKDFLGFRHKDPEGKSLGSVHLSHEQEQQLLDLLLSRKAAREPAEPEEYFTEKFFRYDNLPKGKTETRFAILNLVGQYEAIVRGETVMELIAKEKAGGRMLGDLPMVRAVNVILKGREDKVPVKEPEKPRTEAEIQFEILSLTVDLLALKSGCTREEVIQHCLDRSSKM